MIEKTMLLPFIILGAGAITYLIRVNPIFLARRMLSQGSRFTRFLEYASFGVLGGLISLSIQKTHKAMDPGILGINQGMIPAAITLLIVVIASLKVKNMLACLALGIGTYATLYLLGL